MCSSDLMAAACDVLDLDAYRARIAYTGVLEPTRAVLDALHLAHASHIPFENLDVLLGRPIRLDLDSLQAKLIRGGRGGYCFEHNLLFAALLECAGFSVTRLAARVRYGTERVLPRTHMLLNVSVDGGDWIADVGFGIEGLLLPVAYKDGAEQEQYGRCYRAVPEGGEWTLQIREADRWAALYTFSLAAQQPVDYLPANHYTSTHPDSRFVQTLTVQQPTPEARKVLRNRELAIDRGGAITRRRIADDAALLDVLEEVFDLRFPRGTRFPFRETPPGA